MQPAEEIHVVSPGVFFWQTWSPEAKVELGCTAIATAGGLVLVDPLPLAEPLLERLAAECPLRAIVLTNGNHQRASAEFRARFGLPRHAHADAIGEIEAEHWIEEDEPLLDEFSTIALPGAASGEMALHHAGHRLLVLGDALINLEQTGFSLLPAKYCHAPKKLPLSLKKLLAFSCSSITFAHGLPLVHEAEKRLASLLTA